MQGLVSVSVLLWSTFMEEDLCCRRPRIDISKFLGGKREGQKKLGEIPYLEPWRSPSVEKMDDEMTKERYRYWVLSYHPTIIRGESKESITAVRYQKKISMPEFVRLFYLQHSLDGSKKRRRRFLVNAFVSCLPYPYPYGPKSSWSCHHHLHRRTKRRIIPILLLLPSRTAPSLS